MTFAPPKKAVLNWSVRDIGKRGVPIVSAQNLERIQTISGAVSAGRRRYLRFAFLIPEGDLVVYDGGTDDAAGSDPDKRPMFRDLNESSCNIYYWPDENYTAAIPNC